MILCFLRLGIGKNDELEDHIQALPENILIG